MNIWTTFGRQNILGIFGQYFWLPFDFGWDRIWEMSKSTPLTDTEWPILGNLKAFAHQKAERKEPVESTGIPKENDPFSSTEYRCRQHQKVPNPSSDSISAN